MNVIWVTLLRAQAFGDRQTEFEIHMDNLKELGTAASGQTVEKHNAAVMAAFRLGLMVGKLTEAA